MWADADGCGHTRVGGWTDGWTDGLVRRGYDYSRTGCRKAREARTRRRTSGIYDAVRCGSSFLYARYDTMRNGWTEARTEARMRVLFVRENARSDTDTLRHTDTDTSATLYPFHVFFFFKEKKNIYIYPIYLPLFTNTLNTLPFTLSSSSFLFPL